MSCIVYITNKKTNTKYAYRSESYRDPVTKQPKSRRTYLGRVDPVTNEIIPKAEKGKRNRIPVGKDFSESYGQKSVPSKRVNIAELQQQVEYLRKQQDELKSKVANMDISISKIYSLIHDVEI
ncbi:MAG: hypothetical protein IJ899_18575 [Blautia sp.]|nr:hypothetical protein [Blautia sp.]